MCAADLANPGLVLNIQPGMQISSTPVSAAARAPNLWPTHPTGTSQPSAPPSIGGSFTFGHARAALQPGMPPIAPSHGEYFCYYHHHFNYHITKYYNNI